MNPLVAAAMVGLFHRVPSQVVTMIDWHSEEGEAFLTYVDRAIETGALELTDIGSLIGVENFSQRYKILRRKG